MGTKIKYFLTIVFFPVVILFLIIKKLLTKLKNKTIRKYISTVDINTIDTLNGIEFEDFLQTVFICYGYLVEKTKKSHDYGADLIVKNKDKKIAVQCKLYYKHTVGNSAIQEVATAKDFYNTDEAIVITNSKFSKPAINLAEKIGVKLLDRNDLDKLPKEGLFI